MILPKELLPSGLGLQWGMSSEECSAILGEATLESTDRYTRLERTFEGGCYPVYLMFEGDQLSSIQLVKMRSRNFWDEHTPTEMEAIASHMQDLYTTLVEGYSAELGAPSFTGIWGDDGYPGDQTAGYLAYWRLNGDRFQVEFDQADIELPIDVKLACYPDLRAVA